jgi:hypothetical protein
MTEEVRFEDGNVSDVVRVGDTVRRERREWTPVVHALLRHLGVVGFAGAPRVLGFDERGREVLTYVEGQTIPASLRGYRSDALLDAVARLLRRYRAATVGFRLPAELEWRFQVGAPASGEIICHNDVAPWNTVLVGERPIAFIDWDFAAPAPRAWDIAYALWRFVPLYSDEERDDGFGSPAERARRMALFCDACGLTDRSDVIATIERRQGAIHDTLATWATAGVPGFADRVAEAISISGDLADVEVMMGTEAQKRVPQIQSSPV